MLLAERGTGDPLFLSALVADLTEVPDPVVLVLDGLADQVDRSALDGLALLVDRAGEVLRVVVTSRTDPPLPLVRWRAVGWLAELREDDLRLTDDGALVLGHRLQELAHQVVSQQAVGATKHAVGGARCGVAGRASNAMCRAIGQPSTRWLRATTSAGSRNDVLAAAAMATASGTDWFDPDMCRALVGDAGTGDVPVGGRSARWRDVVPRLVP